MATNDTTDPNAGDQSAPWWQQPKPSYFRADQPWPPPLPPGASYGPNVGQIIYGANTGTSDPTGAGTPVYPQATVPATTPPTTAAPPSTPSAPGTPGTPTDPLFAPIQQPPFAAPTPTALPPTPVFTPPSYTPPPAFSFADFQAPSYQSAASDPGYQFAERQGEDALNRSYAAGGIGDSGTAYKGLIDYGQGAAAQQYQNVFNRDLSSYQTNRANAVDAYNTNYGTQYKDPYTINFANASAQFAPQLTGYQTNAQNTQFNNATGNTNAWNSYLQNYLQAHNNQLDAWNRLFGLATAQ